MVEEELESPLQPLREMLSEVKFLQVFHMPSCSPDFLYCSHFPGLRGNGSSILSPVCGFAYSLPFPTDLFQLHSAKVVLCCKLDIDQDNMRVLAAGLRGKKDTRIYISNRFSNTKWLVLKSYQATLTVLSRLCYAFIHKEPSDTEVLGLRGSKEEVEGLQEKGHGRGREGERRAI